MSARALSCYFISWPCLMVLWVPRQLHLSGLLEPSSTQVGTLPTAHPGTGRPTASGSPPLSNQSWRGREARNQTSQYTDPASPQGLNGAPITQVTRSLGTGLWCDGGGALPLPCPWPWPSLAAWWVGMELADTECCFSRHQISQG